MSAAISQGPCNAFKTKVDIDFSPNISTSCYLFLVFLSFYKTFIIPKLCLFSASPIEEVQIRLAFFPSYFLGDQTNFSIAGSLEKNLEGEGIEARTSQFRAGADSASH